jgi:hypothetical protein
VQLIIYQRLLSTSIAIALSLLFDFENVISGSFPHRTTFQGLFTGEIPLIFSLFLLAFLLFFLFQILFLFLFLFFSKFIFSYISLGLCEPPALTPVAMMVLGTDIFLDLTYCTFRLLCLGYAAFQTTSVTYGSSPRLIYIPHSSTFYIAYYGVPKLFYNPPSSATTIFFPSLFLLIFDSAYQFMFIYVCRKSCGAVPRFSLLSPFQLQFILRLSLSGSEKHQ